jgi:hypothetical protein
MKVSWQVTGVRIDPWAEARRIEVEERKNADERGHYLHPHLHGAPLDKSLGELHHPRPKQVSKP